MKKGLKGTLKILGFLCLGFLLLWYVSKDQDGKKIIHEIVNANYWWIILAMLAALLSHYFRALRWNLLISSLGYKTKTSSTFFALMVGYLLNLAVPRIGEISRCGALNRSSNIPFSILFGTVLSERFFDLLCLLVLIAATILLQLSLLRSFLGKYIYYPFIELFESNYIMIVIILVIISVVLVFSYKFLKNKLKKPKPKSRMSWLKMQIKGILSGIKTLRYMRQKKKFILYTIMVWVNYLLMGYLCFFAIKGTSHLGIDAGFTILSLGSLGIVAPVPGGIGTYHFIVKKVLTEIYDIGAEYAISFAYISHASQIILVLVLGVISLVILSVYFKFNIKQTTNKGNISE